jgi:hypothetical protein
VFELEADIAGANDHFRVQLTVLDWDKLSSDDHFDNAAIEISEVAENGPKMDRNRAFPEPEDVTRTF